MHTFGGISSGPQPLIDLHKDLEELFDKYLLRKSEPYVDSTAIVDIMNMTGKTVVSGNIRRVAEIAFGAHND